MARCADGLPDDPAWEALASGDLEAASDLAEDLLRRAEHRDEDDWPAGDLQHRAHTVLGHICLKRGDLDGASARLIASAEVEPTPVLSSLGPHLSLAWELLIAGQPDSVVAFARRFSASWRINSPADDDYSS